MKRKSIIIAAAVAATVGAGALAFGTSSFAQPYHGGWGYMGPGMMGGYGPGPGPAPGPGPRPGYGPGWMHGWMHGGYGPGWMHGRYGRGGYGPGWCWRNDGRYGTRGPTAQPGQADQQQTKLTVDDVKARMGRWLAYQGNPHIKLGTVKETDPNTITADIVTTDNSLVQRFVIDRNTGFYHPADESAEQPTQQPTPAPAQKPAQEQEGK